MCLAVQDLEIKDTVAEVGSTDVMTNQETWSRKEDVSTVRREAISRETVLSWEDPKADLIPIRISIEEEARAILPPDQEAETTEAKEDLPQAAAEGVAAEAPAAEERAMIEVSADTIQKEAKIKSVDTRKQMTDELSLRLIWLRPTRLRWKIKNINVNMN